MVGIGLVSAQLTYYYYYYHYYYYGTVVPILAGCHCLPLSYTSLNPFYYIILL